MLPPYEVSEADRDLLDCGVVLSARARVEAERLLTWALWACGYCLHKHRTPVAREFCGPECRRAHKERVWRRTRNANKKARLAAQPKAPRLTQKQRESRALAQHWGGGG